MKKSFRKLFSERISWTNSLRVNNVLPVSYFVPRINSFLIYSFVSVTRIPAHQRCSQRDDIVTSVCRIRVQPRTYWAESIHSEHCNPGGRSTSGSEFKVKILYASSSVSSQLTFIGHILESRPRSSSIGIMVFGASLFQTRSSKTPAELVRHHLRIEKVCP